MAKVLQPITACFRKPEIMEESSATASENACNSQPGMIWKVSSGIFNMGSSAIGLGIGSVKWAATTTYSVGTGVVSATQNVVSKVHIGKLAKPKSKNE